MEEKLITKYSQDRVNITKISAKRKSKIKEMVLSLLQEFN